MLVYMFKHCLYRLREYFNEPLFLDGLCHEEMLWYCGEVCMKCDLVKCFN